MNLPLKIISDSPVNESEWLKYCKNSHYATFFHTPFWAKLFSPPYVISTRKLIFNDGVDLVIPFVRRRLLGGIVKVYISMPASTFGGCISDSNLTLAHHELVLQHLKKYQDLIWRENPYDPAMQDLRIPNCQKDYTYVIDLQGGFEQVLEKSDYSNRKAVKVAQKSGIEIEKAESLDKWDEYFDMYQESISRWKKREIFSGVEYSRELIHKIFSMDGKYRSLWIANCKSRPVAGIVCFYWNKHAVAWHGAGLQEYFKFRPNNLLYMHAIKDACSNGYRWFDCNPSGGIEGVIKFKKNLGAVELQSRIVNRKSVIRTVASYVKIFKKKW